jgi:ABC-type transport system substrate-binding protein
MMWLRRIIIALPVLLALFFAVAFISVRVSAPRKLNQFISGSIGEPEILNPILSTTTAASQVENRIFSGLIRYDENLEVEGDLARSWEIAQSSRCHFAAEADARAAIERIEARREQWGPISLREARQDGATVQLEFASAGTSYQETLLGWLGDLKPLPVTFLSVGLESRKEFDGGGPVNSANFEKRLLAALKAHPEQLDRRVLYLWTGGATSMLELPVAGPVEPVTAVIEDLLKAKAGKDALGSVEAEDPSPTLDEPRITFRLRSGVRWHDGEPFTAEDVLFTYQSLMSEQVASPRRADYELVREVKVADPLTLRVTYKRPYAPALVSWGMGMLPRHLLDGKPTKWWAEHFNRKPVGCGPFIFEEWRSNEYIKLRRNPDYWEGAPHLERIVLRFIPDMLALRLSFETGELDVQGVEPHALGRMGADPRYEVFSRIVPMFDYIGWNLERPLFQDRRVRQALAHAVNVQEIITYVLYGQGTQSNGIFPPQMWFANPAVKPLEYDPDRAKALLAEAGWKERDAEGWLVKDGKRFEFTLITNQGNETRKDIATLVQEQFRRIGISVKVEIYEWAVFIKKKVDVHDFDACVLGWSLGYDYDQYQIWHSSQNKPGGLNFVSYKNPRVDKLLMLARSEFDRERVKKYCAEIQRTIYDDQPYLFLEVPRAVTALHRGTYRVSRPAAGGGFLDEPIRSTKAGIGVYDTWWYRTIFPPEAKARLAP